MLIYSDRALAGSETVDVVLGVFALVPQRRVDDGGLEGVQLGLHL